MWACRVLVSCLMLRFAADEHIPAGGERSQLAVGHFARKVRQAAIRVDKTDSLGTDHFRELFDSTSHGLRSEVADTSDTISRPSTAG